MSQSTVQFTNKIYKIIYMNLLLVYNDNNCHKTLRITRRFYVRKKIRCHIVDWYRECTVLNML